MKKTIIICAVALIGFAAFAQDRQGMGRRMRGNPDAKLHRFSTTVEKERPQLNDETKRLIAAKYCKWLGERDPAHTYRIPTEEEWELAAGHMPKDADFNCGVGDSICPVDTFAQTKGASGGIDFWGNCWEWTATKRNGKNAVKGGAFDSKRTDCRTEAKNTAKAASKGYPNVTMRLVRETR